MAVYQPHKLSTQLCRLFDSGRCTVDQFARLLDESPTLIERVANNPAVKVNPELHLRIGKVLAKYHRAYPETRPLSEYKFAQQRSAATPIADRIEKKAGVVEESSPREDERVFSLRDVSGRWRYIVTTRSEDTDDEEIEVLWRLLQWKEKRRLQIMG